MAINTLFYHGKKLVPIDVVKDIINSEGKAKSDIFNLSGAILVKEGMPVPDRIFHMPIYTYVTAYNQYTEHPEGGSTQPEQVQQKLTETVEQKTERLTKVCDPFTVYTVTETSKQVEQILNKIPDSPANFSTARTIVERTFDMDRVDLHRCINELRTADTYTYNHSYSVYLLFVQSMQDFKKYIDKDEFWDLFKESYHKVNFNLENIKLYGAGALLHDLGKAFLPSNILKKAEKLDEDEIIIMKKHPRLGVQALEKAGVTNPHVLEIVGNHHGRYLTYKDRGQSALTIIANIVDIYDACRSERIYKPVFSFERTMEILDIEKRDLQWNKFLYDIVVKETLPKFEKKQ